MDAIRAFIAIELPAPILAQLEQVESRLRPLLPPDCLRWVKPDSVHLTLKFLGQVPSDQIDIISSALRNSVAALHSFELEVGGAGCFPNLQRPRVMWVGIQEEAPGGRLSAVQRAVENSIAPMGYPTEPRAFSPHLTLGRLARDVSSSDLRKIGEVVRASAVGSLGHWTVSQVALIKSDLRPSGAVYTTLAHMPLASKG
jgi:2'-5' RNA ligase